MTAPMTREQILAYHGTQKHEDCWQCDIRDAALYGLDVEAASRAAQDDAYVEGRKAAQGEIERLRAQVDAVSGLLYRADVIGANCEWLGRIRAVVEGVEGP